MNENDILEIIREDKWMMGVLRTAGEMHLPDWMIGAGFVRNKIWDYLHGYSRRTPLEDVDVIYFDTGNRDESREKELERILEGKMPNVPWSVKNQARMHIINGDKPYESSADAISHWPELPTCVAVKLAGDDKLELVAPHGIEALVNLEVRPSPNFSERLQYYRDRVNNKNWQAKWPKLKIYNLE